MFLMFPLLDLIKNVLYFVYEQNQHVISKKAIYHECSFFFLFVILLQHYFGATLLSKMHWQTNVTFIMPALCFILNGIITLVRLDGK